MNMRSSQQFGLAFRPKSIVGAHTTTIARRPIASGGATWQEAYTNAKLYPVGACTAGVLKTILSVSGPGAISFLALKDATSGTRTERIRVTLDGVVFLDAQTDGSTPSQNAYACDIIGSLICGYTGSYLLPLGVAETPALFETSCLVEYSTSATETPNSALGIIHYTR
jgi:hypothetical protein